MGHEDPVGFAIHENLGLDSGSLLTPGIHEEGVCLINRVFGQQGDAKCPGGGRRAVVRVHIEGIGKESHRIGIPVRDPRRIRLLQAEDIGIHGPDRSQLAVQIRVPHFVKPLLDVISHDLELRSTLRGARAGYGYVEGKDRKNRQGSDYAGRETPGDLWLPERERFHPDQQQGQSHSKSRQQIDKPETVPEQGTHHGCIIINGCEHLEEDHYKEE